ncbi:MAG: hypothetical protein ACPGSM_22090 [Thiolinea sp.]
MQTAIFNPGLAYAEYNQRKFAYVIAAIVAFTMSSYFVVGYLAGDLIFWGWDISQSMNGAVGVGICLVMTSYQFILYSQGDVEGGKKATILAVCVAVGFSLLSEVGQGMERDHIRMEARSIESPTYQAVIGKIGTATGPVAHPYSAKLERAEMKLARCKQKVNAGEWEDCVESTARLNSVKKSITEFYQQNQQHAVTLANTAKTLEKDETNYHPLVSLIKGALSSTGVFASFILSLILISFFEYAFHYLGRQLAAKRIELLSHGFDVTRRNRKTPKALKRIQDNSHPAPPENTWNDELEKSGLDSPADAALNQSADPEQVKRIVDRGSRTQDTIRDTSPDRTLYSADRTQDAIRDTSQDGTQDTIRDTSQDGTQNTGKRPDIDSLYPVILLSIKKRIITRDIKPTVRPVTDAILTFARENHQQINIKTAAFTKPIRQQMAQKILEQLETESIVVRNPEGGVGKPKYLLAEKYRNKILGSEDEQLNMQLA